MLRDRLYNQMPQLDLTGRGYIYDGLEPEFTLPGFRLPGATGAAFHLGDFVRQPFQTLLEQVTAAAFRHIFTAHGFKHPVGPWESWTGTDNLALYHFRVDGAVPPERRVAILAYGEFQPARYLLHLEGVWTWPSTSLPDPETHS